MWFAILFLGRYGCSKSLIQVLGESISYGFCARLFGSGGRVVLCGVAGRAFLARWRFTLEIEELGEPRANSWICAGAH